MRVLTHEIDVLRPKPSPTKLIRIGGNRDGAYLLPDDLENIKACFSPGVSNRKDFEDELLDHYGIVSHMCDYSSDSDRFKTQLKGGQSFKKLWLDVDGSENSVSLENWVNELAPNVDDDLILQMDIEGAEYRNLLGTPESILKRFRIIVIELHSLRDFLYPENFTKEMAPLLTILDKHFTCVHAHPNNCGGDFVLADSGVNVPNVLELTFLRRDRWKGISEDDLHQPLLPHPHDISWNVRSKPPLFLNENWLSTRKRTLESTIKMLSDQVQYFESEKKLDHEVSTSRTHQALIGVHRLAQHAASMIPEAHAMQNSQIDWTDLAKGKTFTISSKHTANPNGSVVIDCQPFFFHTKEGYDEFITIDLDREQILFELVIANRSNVCKERARCLFYCAHTDPIPDLKQGLPVTIDDSFLNKESQVSRTNLKGIKGRYVTVYSPDFTCLHFSSIKIMGLKF
jgi:hypothetical protein